MARSEKNDLQSSYREEVIKSEVLAWHLPGRTEVNDENPFSG
jgi:hypothetical protein